MPQPKSHNMKKSKAQRIEHWFLLGGRGVRRGMDRLNDLVLHVGFGSASITNSGPYNPIQAPEHSIETLEGSESENHYFQGLLVWWKCLKYYWVFKSGKFGIGARQVMWVLDCLLCFVTLVTPCLFVIFLVAQN